MNAARRRNSDLGLPNRVYLRRGRYYWVRPSDGKWIGLTQEKDGTAAMLGRLASEVGAYEADQGTGNMPALITDYVLKHKGQHKEKAWPSYGKYAKQAFADRDVQQVDPIDIRDFLTENWTGKLPMQRIMRAFMSGFFEWCISKRLVKMNPCREVRLKKPKPRTVYITDEHFHAIRAAMLEYKRKNKDGTIITSKVPSGDMTQCFFDLCYLTLQRSTEIRLLRLKPDPKNPGGSSWVDRDAGVIHFVPTKTEDSSGEVVDIPITKEIKAVLDRALATGNVKSAYVIHTALGQPYTANGILSAFKRAKKRAGLADLPYNVKDMRAKAVTDGAKAGYKLEELKVAAVHTTVEQTEDYIKQRIVPVSEVHMRLPNQPKKSA